MKTLADLITANEDWLMEQILNYAIKYGYAQYTSTLKEPWRLSICGLSEPLLASLETAQANIELNPNEDYIHDPVAAFGILEAARHRKRGIDIGMFLGLFKYYRQSYIDLVERASFEPVQSSRYIHYLHRFFDRIEIGFCSEWTAISDNDFIKELQASNRAMTNEKNKFLTLFESLANPVILLDDQNRIDLINHSAAQLFHISANRYYDIQEHGNAFDPARNEAIGRPVTALIPWIADELDTFTGQHTPYVECEKSIETSEGIKYYQIKFSAMMDVSGKFTGILVILNDETQQKLAEERVREAKDAAEAANRAKSEFLANMSHELRTPLNAVLGFTQILSNGTNLSGEQQENLAIIKRSGEHLLDLINQVLDLSKIESGRILLNKTGFDLYKLLEDTLNIFKPLTQTKDISIAFEMDAAVPRFVFADEVKLRQILINLLNNAVKFTVEGGIALRVNCVETTPATPQSPPSAPVQLLFEIEDSGPGIPPADMDSIFEAFKQAGAAQKMQEGTGLGLTISRNFVRLMGGDIIITSHLGQGTLVKFNIVAHKASPQDVRSHSKVRQKVTGLHPEQPDYKILIVDDKPDNRFLLVKLLQPLGFEVVEAANGQEAIATWQEWQPHLIFMDIRMPVMDGYSATRVIRGSPGGPETIIIAVSASTFEEERDAILKVGCNDFLRKPFADTAIFSLLQKHLDVKYSYSIQPSDSQRASAYHSTTPAEMLAEIEALPAPWLASFKEAIEIIDLETTRKLIDQLNRDHNVLAHYLVTHVDNFRFDILQKLVQEADHDQNK